MPEQKNKYAQVIVDVPDLDTRTFSYLIPDGLYDHIKPGIPVLVPFGNRGAVNAFVVGFSNYLPEGIKARSIYEILGEEPIFSVEHLKLLEWVSNYYCCDLQTVIDTAIPSDFVRKTKRIVSLVQNADLSEKYQKKIYDFLQNQSEYSISALQKRTKIPYKELQNALQKLKKAGIVKIETVIGDKKAKPKLEQYVKLLSIPSNTTLTTRKVELIEKLQTMGGQAKLSDFIKQAGTTHNTVKNLVNAGFIQVFEKETYRNPSEIFSRAEQSGFLRLTPCQQTALDRITGALRDKDPEPLLLYGVTGSGKTEVYMHAAKEALSQGKSVIILAPEILLASQLALRFSARFGAQSVAVWHSNISEGERHDVWKRLMSGEIRIITGARSAIFVPVRDLGLIIIDEEHESSYKQTSPTPRYNAKTIAAERARREGAVLVLGSATPDITTFFRAESSKRVITLPERVGTGGLATVNIVDMREEASRNNRSIFSKPLKTALENTFKQRKQAILLINRRGFSTYGQCTVCGYSPKCNRCEIPLILHKTGNKLRCHYCNYETDAYELCPSCNIGAIKYYGMGTQRAEELFRAEFPQIKVKRIDSDIMSKKNAHIEILEAFSKGETDVLIGTQMIAKGLDVSNVTLVGVISSDSLFTIPDYRGTERGFQLLTQVAGRAGRGDFSGTVYFQTYTPDFFALNYAREQDFTKFYRHEIESRNACSYPPFSNIIRLIISSKQDIKAIKFSTDLAYRLRLIAKQRGLTERLEVLGPSRCIITKIKDEYRYHVLVKNTLGERGHFLVSGFVKEVKIPADIRFLVDVDPSDML